MNIFTLVGEIVLDGVEKAQSQLDSFQQRVKDNTKELGELRKAGLALAAIGGAITAVIALITKGALDEQITINRLDLALKNVRMNYASLRDEIEGALTSISSKTNYSVEEQRNALTRLIGTTGTYENALSLLEIATDLAAAKDMDLETAVTIVGRAVKGNTELLSRYGIVIAGTHNPTYILTQLHDRFAGAAEAAVNPVTQLKNLIGDLGNEIGSLLLPFLEGLVNWLKPIIEGIRNWVAEHPDLAKWIVITTGVIGGLLFVFGSLLATITTFIILAPAMGAAWAVITGPIGILILAIGAVIAAIVLLAYNWETVWNGIKTVTHAVIQFLINAVLGFVNGFVNIFISAVNAIISMINLLPFVEIPEIPLLGLKYELPEWKGGGLIDEPTLLYGLQSQRPYAIAGESGPERVVPGGGTIHDQTSLERAVAEAVEKGLSGLQVLVGGDKVASIVSRKQYGLQLKTQRAMGVA